MASHATTHKRVKAISHIQFNYPAIHKVPEDSMNWEQWIYEIAERFDTSRRTAIEYMRTAKARRIREVKEHETEMALYKERMQQEASLSETKEINDY